MSQQRSVTTLPPRCRLTQTVATISDRAYYRAYSQQAGKHIGDGAGGESMTRGAGGGAQFVCSTCVTLVGEVDFDSLATMQYPDRASFLDHIRELNAITEGTEQADG